MALKKNQILFVLLFHISVIYSQAPLYYHYTTLEGLASSTVYDIVQDRNGFIWFATLNGLNRFDGSRFITYSMTEGLNSNSLTSLLMGTDGNIYIGNHEKGINVIRNNNIEKYYNETKEKRFNISQLVEAHGIVYAFETYGLIGLIGNSDFSLLRTHPLVVNRLCRSRDDDLIALTSGGLYEIKNKKLEKLHIVNLPAENLYSTTWYKDGSSLIGGNGNIYVVKNKKVIKQYSVRLYEENIIFNLLLDSQQNIWFSIKGKGFYCIPNGSTKIFNIGAQLGLEKTLINSMIQDDEGNIWVATYGKGVYCLNNLHIQNYSDKDGLTNSYINCIQKSESGKIILGTLNGISILDNGVIKPLKYSSGKNVTGYINNFIPSEKYLVVSLTSEKAKSAYAQYKDQKFRFMRFQSFCETNKGLFLFGSTGNNIRIEKDFPVTNNPPFIYAIGNKQIHNRINYIFEDSGKNLWFASNLGVCKLSYEKDEPDISKWNKVLFLDNPVLNSKIVCVYQDKKNDLWFAGSNGIARIRAINDSISSYTNIGGFDLSNSTSITSDKLDRIWIGNMKGVFVYDGYTIRQIDDHSGLASNEVISLLSDRESDKLYVGTSNGLSEIAIKSYDSYKIEPPKIILNKVVSGNTTYLNFTNLTFDRDKNNVTVDISAINYSSPRSLVYKYKLNDVWFETNNSILNFSSLQNGTYNLKIIAKTQNSKWSKPYLLSFVVKPGFTETVWFKAGFFLLLFSLALSAVLWRTKQKTKRISEQIELNERINTLKHEALSAMMNPHFIFNSLNSVQYLINSQRNEEANDYIAMMAKLIRKNLDTAGSGFILLAEEINRLKIYLDLEKLRFQDRFTYEISIGRDVETNFILIPNMIIQPFVENSLWHGIINSGTKGFLTISFNFENVEIDAIIYRSLIIKVTDNGIGINEAKKNKKEDHISKGIQIIEERLKLLSAKMEIPKPIMFEDLSSNDSRSHGTEIIVSLPPPLYKNITPLSSTTN